VARLQIAVDSKSAPRLCVIATRWMWHACKTHCSGWQARSAMPQLCAISQRWTT